MNLGIIVPNLRSSQLAYYLGKNINQLVEQTNHINPVIFVEQTTLPCISIRSAIMSLNEIWNFNGILMSTTLHNTMLMLKAVIDAQKFYYVWDLEWLRNSKNFLYNMQIFRNPNINLVARSIDHAKIIENYCNRPVSIVLPNINLNGFLQALQEKNNVKSQR